MSDERQGERARELGAFRGQSGRGRVTAQAGSLLPPTLTFRDQPSPSSRDLPQASFPLCSCRPWTRGPATCLWHGGCVLFPREPRPWHTGRGLGVSLLLSGRLNPRGGDM